MKSFSVLALVVLSTATFTSAWDNTPPIPDRLPGAGFEQGSNKYGIDIEIIYDLGCPTCKAEHPEVQKLLDAPFLDGTVRDAVTIRYAFCPLTFHYGAWITTKMIPYIEDLCFADKTQCSKFIDYVTLAFLEQDWVITATNLSYNALVDKWT